MSRRTSKDLLGGSNSTHNRSSHAKDEFTSVTVRKSDPSEKAGIRLAMEENGRVRVTNIAQNGLFYDSEIEVGDIVLSINGKRLRAGEGPEALINVISTAKATVTVVVKKTSMKPRKSVQPLDPKEIEDNNRRSGSLYLGKARHNEDGSLKLAYDGDKDPRNDNESMIISASKDFKRFTRRIKQHSQPIKSC